MTIDLRHGRWQDVIGDVERVDAIITDPPYSERVHAWHNAGASATRTGTKNKAPLGYDNLSPDGVGEIVSALAPKNRGWWCVMTDHLLARAWEERLVAAGLYVFAPLPVVMRGMSVRLVGDGPSSWSVWLVVARPKARAFSTWGTLPGAYIGSPRDKGIGDCQSSRAANKHRVVGSKPLWLMRSIIRDYTRPGDIVLDPFAGGGATLVAAAIESRRAVGVEVDRETFSAAHRRIANGHTPDMFTMAAHAKAKKAALASTPDML